jgi:hypothetical protein
VEKFLISDVKLIIKDDRSASTDTFHDKASRPKNGRKKFVRYVSKSHPYLLH